MSKQAFPTHRQKDSTPRRIDFMFGNRLALRAINSCCTVRTPTEGHGTVCAAFDWGILRGQCWVLSPVVCLALPERTAEDKVLPRFKITPKQKAQDVLKRRAESIWGPPVPTSDSFASWHTKAERYLSKVRTFAGLRVGRASLGRGQRRLVLRQITPCVARAGRAGSSGQCSSEHSFVACRRVKLVSRLEHMQIWLSKGLRLQAIAVWCHIQGAGFHCILREGAEELDNEARSILEIFNSRFNDLSIENLGTLFKFVHDGVRKADQSNRARRAKNFRDRLRRPDGFMGQEAWTWLRNVCAPELAFLGKGAGANRNPRDIDVATKDVWFPFWQRDVTHRDWTGLLKTFDFLNIPCRFEDALSELDVRAAIVCMPPGRQGPEGWSTDELKQLPKVAIAELTSLFRKCESEGGVACMSIVLVCCAHSKARCCQQKCP